MSIRDVFTREGFGALILKGLRRVFSFGKNRINEPEKFEEIEQEARESLKKLKQAKTKEATDEAIDKVLDKF